MTEKLKPCPFCGGKAVYSSITFLHGDDQCHVECEKCGFTTENFKTRYDAIDAWNRRANDE